MAEPQLISLIKKGAPVDDIRTAIRKGASVKAWDELGQHPLHHAIKYSQKETATLLLDADDVRTVINVKGGIFKSTPLHLLSQHTSDWTEIAAMMIKKGAYVDIQDGTGKTPLYHAVGSGVISLIELLVANDAKVDAIDNFGITPLFNAREKGIAAFLVGKGADIEHRDNKLNTPIFEAAYWGRLGVISFLLEKGASLLTINIYYETPLHSILSWTVDSSQSEFEVQKKTVALLVEHCGKHLPSSTRPHWEIPKNFNPNMRHSALNEIMDAAHQKYLEKQTQF